VETYAHFILDVKAGKPIFVGVAEGVDEGLGEPFDGKSVEDGSACWCPS
jgi:hypothetical protein